jgi:Mrp family chromosome partitioning ATPase/capsular polysaccharide biosynthesis protein
MPYTERLVEARDEAWPASAREQDFVTLYGMLEVFKRSLWRILLVIALAVFAAAVYVMMTPRGYTSTAQIMIESQKQQLLWQTPGLLDLTVDNAQVESQVEILRSERIASQVIDRLNLTEDAEFQASQAPSKFEQHRLAVAAFVNALGVRRVGQSYIIEISFSSRDPEKAARIANAIADAYIHDQLEAKADAARQASRWMEERLTQLGRQLNAAANAVHEFRTANGIADRTEGRSLLIDKLTELEATAGAYRKLYEALLQRMGENQQQESFPVSNARVIATATTPLAPSYPRTKLIIALALLVGTAAGIALTLVRHTLDRSLRTERQVRDELGIDCFGLVPRLRRDRETAPAGSDNPAIDAPLSEYVDALRGIKVSIDGACSSRPNWRLGLLSVDPVEGKTALAIGLADLCAAAGSRTLLVDANLRDPALSRQLAPGARAGLLNALLEPHGKPAILSDPKTNVHLLPAGDAVPIANSADLLASPAMRELMSDLGEQFNATFVDLPPLARAPDARVIGSALDGCILVVQWGTTSLEALKNAQTWIETAQIRLLGVVITDVAEGVPPLFGVTLADVRGSRVFGWVDRLVYQPLSSRWAMFWGRAA